MSIERSGADNGRVSRTPLTLKDPLRGRGEFIHYLWEGRNEGRDRRELSFNPTTTTTTTTENKVAENNRKD